MTQKNKSLLLQDLCARLPYGVILNCCNFIGEKLTSIDENGLINNDYDIDEVKPYLFPLSSMTKEQREEFDKVISAYIKDLESDGQFSGVGIVAEIDFYHKYHLDYRGLIEKGLAIDATNLNIY